MATLIKLFRLQIPIKTENGDGWQCSDITMLHFCSMTLLLMSHDHCGAHMCVCVCLIEYTHAYEPKRA